jgi:hypothetical protein
MHVDESRSGAFMLVLLRGKSLYGFESSDTKPCLVLDNNVAVGCVVLECKCNERLSNQQNLQRDIEAFSRKYCHRGKATSIKNFVRVLALVIQRVNIMRRTVICGLSGFTRDLCVF